MVEITPARPSGQVVLCCVIYIYILIYSIQVRARAPEHGVRCTYPVWTRLYITRARVYTRIVNKYYSRVCVGCGVSAVWRQTPLCVQLVRVCYSGLRRLQIIIIYAIGLKGDGAAGRVTTALAVFSATTTPRSIPTNHA